MRKFALALTVVLAMSTGLLCASDDSRHDPNLQPIDWLAHGKWTATVTPPEGKPVFVENEIRWAETGTAIHFLTRFNGEAHYYGVYLYDPVEKQIKFFYSSSDGEMTQGKSVATEKGLKQEFAISNARGVQKLWSTIEKTNNDEYDFTVFAAGSDKPIFKVHYTRK